MKKPRFSLEKHQEVGKELNVIRDHLNTLLVEIGRAYPKQDRVNRRAQNAHNAVEKLRSSLEDCFLEEYLDEDDRGVYYGPTEIDFRQLLASSKQK